ncbi:hypothetical protein QAD02_008588 [Eretmocerus hayati]|uniref:Uncharacterized protein n=1 Tax=Eretmocerus hayati TaxID=131215 RepID=A0ACC2N8A4_9HYME|nr:hypothetical protein QAD02_008588 [Eretmocerus hayati]
MRYNLAIFMSTNLTIVAAVLVNHFDMEFFFQKDPIFDPSLVHDNSVLSAECRDEEGIVWYNHINAYEKSFFCTIVFQNIYFDLKRSKVRKCNMKMQEIAMFDISLGHVNDDTFVLSYYRIDYDGFRYMQVFLGRIDNQRDCKIVKKFGFRDDHHLGQVLTSQESFHVVTSASKICVNLKMCIATYDKYGRKEDHIIPVPYNSENDFHVIRMQEPDIQKYFIVETDRKDDTKYQLTLTSFETSGITRLLMNVSTEEGYIIHQADNNRKFTLCVKYVHNHVCNQYDEKSEQKLHKFIKFDSHHGISVAHNLVNDGLVLAHGTCVKKLKILECDDWVVSRFYEDGQVKVLNVTVKSPLICNSDKSGFHPYTIEDGSTICFYVICLYINSIAQSGKNTVIRSNARMFCINRRMLRMIPRTRNSPTVVLSSYVSVADTNSLFMNKDRDLLGSRRFMRSMEFLNYESYSMFA